jgi:putative ABC transport system permease protein
VLTESLVLAVVGAALGLVVAFGALKGLSASGGSALPRLAEVEMDGTALVFTFGLAILTGLLFGLAPAIRAPSLALAEAIKGGQGGSRKPGGLGLQSGLVVGQVALSMVLLVGAGLLIRSFVEMQRVEMGFEARGVLTASLQLPGDAFGPDRPPNEFYEVALDRVRAVPGVEDAGIITRLPIVGGAGPWNYVHAENRPAATPADRKGATRRVVSPGYFEALGIELVSGRTFDAGDAQDGSSVVVISRALQEEFFAGEDPVGRSLVLSGWDPPVHLEIVGVVGDARMGSLDSDAGQVMYWPLAQNDRLSVSIAVRTQGDPTAIAPLLREALQETDPNVSVSDVQPMSEIVSASFAQSRFRTVLLGMFAGLAVLLASLGLYGVLAQLVGGRTRELGVRIAVGARTSDILGLVMKSGVRLAVIGIGIGLLGGSAAAYVASSLLFNVKPMDPATYAATGLTLLVVALAASAIPAWNASRVDPVNSLRAE